MSVVRQWLVVDAPPEEVWRVVANPRNLPKWNRYIRSVEGVPNGELAVGDRYTTTMGLMGVTFRVDAHVDEIDPPRFSRIKLAGPLDAVVRTWVRPIGTNRSRLEHEVDYRLKGGPVGEVVARGLKVIGAPTLLKRGLRAQKRQVESR